MGSVKNMFSVKKWKSATDLLTFHSISFSDKESNF